MAVAARRGGLWAFVVLGVLVTHQVVLGTYFYSLSVMYATPNPGWATGLLHSLERFWDCSLYWRYGMGGSAAMVSTNGFGVLVAFWNADQRLKWASLVALVAAIAADLVYVSSVTQGRPDFWVRQMAWRLVLLGILAAESAIWQRLSGKKGVQGAANAS